MSSFNLRSSHLCFLNFFKSICRVVNYIYMIKSLERLTVQNQHKVKLNWSYMTSINDTDAIIAIILSDTPFIPKLIA